MVEPSESDIFHKPIRGASGSGNAFSIGLRSRDEGWKDNPLKQRRT